MAVGLTEENVDQIGRPFEEEELPVTSSVKQHKIVNDGVNPRGQSEPKDSMRGEGRTKINHRLTIENPFHGDMRLV